MKVKFFLAFCALVLAAIFLLSPTLPGSRVKTKAERVNMHITVLCIGLRMYEVDHGVLPGKLGDLKHDYLDPSVFIDPWGNEYHYIRYLSQSEELVSDWKIWTFGEDNKLGGVDKNKDIDSVMVCPHAETAI